MPWQFEKFAIIDTAKKQYDELMDLLKRSSAEDPYSALPAGLVEVMKQYETLSAIYNSTAFRKALEEYSGQIKVPTEFRAELEKIVNKSIFEGDPFWGR